MKNILIMFLSGILLGISSHYFVHNAIFIGAIIGYVSGGLTLYFEFEKECGK